MFILHDLAWASLSLPAAFALREDFSFSPEDVTFLLWATPVAGVVAHVAFMCVGSYRMLWSHLTVRDFLCLVAGSTLAVLGFVTLGFLHSRLLEVPRSVPIIQWLVMTMGLCGGRLLYEALRPERRQPKDRQVLSPILLVGGGSSAALISHMLEHASGTRWRPVGILDDRYAPRQVIAGVPILGGLSDFGEVIGRLSLQGRRPKRVIITVPHGDLGAIAVRRLEQAALDQEIPVENLPDLLRLRGEPASDAFTLDAPLLPTTMQALGRRPYFIGKRCIDIVVSVVVLILLAPVLALLAVLLRATVGGPVLFRQVRPGRNKVPFVLYKLRTMRDLFGPNGTPLPDAYRTPWLGRIVRRTRLDELPQFWNVLVGDMSIVGPRPMLESDLAQLPQGRGHQRYAFRPGITGWAQVHGGQQLRPAEKLALDIWYTHHASARLDLKIALLTIKMMIVGERVDREVIERAQASLASI